MDVVHRRAAGIDIGSQELYVSIGSNEVKSFGTFTEDLKELGQYIVNSGVSTVAMEATGVYWINVYELLTELGVDVCSWMVGRPSKFQVARPMLKIVSGLDNYTHMACYVSAMSLLAM